MAEAKDGHASFAGRLGQRIARLRQAQRPVLSQEQLGARIGATRDYVSRLERGEVDLPLSLAVRAAAVLGVSLVRLVDNGGDARDDDDWRRVSIEAIRAFGGDNDHPEVAASAIHTLAELIAAYVRDGSGADRATRARARGADRARRSPRRADGPKSSTSAPRQAPEDLPQDPWARVRAISRAGR